MKDAIGLIVVLATLLITLLIMSNGCAMFGEGRAAGKPAAMLLVTTARSFGSQVSLSRIALARSSNPAVKRFAQQAIADHERMIQELRGIANHRGVSILPVPDEMNQQMAAHLLKLSGAELDREYIWEIVSEHAKMAVKFEPEGQQQKDPEIRHWAARQLPLFQQRLQMALRLHHSLLSSEIAKSSSGIAPRP
jgi:putative membrane protein